jgi:ELWxxDGT repeat protein
MLTVAAAGAILAFFVASDFRHGRELWSSDGSSQGTHMVADLSRGTSDTEFGLAFFRGCGIYRN